MMRCAEFFLFAFYTEFKYNVIFTPEERTNSALGPKSQSVWCETTMAMILQQLPTFERNKKNTFFFFFLIRFMISYKYKLLDEKCHTQQN
jgi:hypothetical protein